LKNKTKKKEQLVSELKKERLELRSDSKMCEFFIKGSKSALPLEETVFTMKKMNILINNCNLLERWREKKQNMDWFDSKEEYYEEYELFKEKTLGRISKFNCKE